VLALGAWRWYVGKAPWVHVAIGLLGVLVVARVALHFVDTQDNLRRARERLARSPFSGAEVRIRYDTGLYLTAAAGAAMTAGAILASRQIKG